MKAPDFRAQAIADGTPPSGALEEALKALLEGNIAPEEVKYAYSIYEDAYKSEVLEAFLLAEVPSDKIYGTLRVPTKVIEIYKHLFFDRKVFQDELDVEAYTQNYPEDSKEHKWAKDLKISAIVLGEEYLIYRFGRKDADLDLTAALKSIIVNAYMLTKVTKLNPLDSNTAREARGWSGMAIKAVETFARVKPTMEQTDTEWQVALETIEHTTNEAKSGIKKDEIVH